MLEEGTDCHHCGENPGVVLCKGCGIALCNQCVKLEEYGFGCDGCKIVAFCPDCYLDPDVNTVARFEK